MIDSFRSSKGKRTSVGLIGSIYLRFATGALRRALRRVPLKQVGHHDGLQQADQHQGEDDDAVGGLREEKRHFFYASPKRGDAQVMSKVNSFPFV